MEYEQSHKGCKRCGMKHVGDQDLTGFLETCQVLHPVDNTIQVEGDVFDLHVAAE